MTKKRGFLGFFACLFVAMFFATGAFAASDIYLDCPVPDENSVAVGFWNNVAEPNFGGEPLGFSGSANSAISVGFEPYVINPHRVTTSVETGITDGVGNCVAVIWYMSDHGMFYRFVQYSENAELYDHAPTLEPYSKIPFGWITTVPGYYLELPIYQEFLQESNETKAKIFAAIPYQSYNSQDAKYYPFRTNTLCTQGSYCASNNMDSWDWNGYATGQGTSVKGIEQCDGGWPSAPGATECDETGNYIQFDCVDNKNGSGRTGANADFVNGYSFSRMVDDNVHMVCQAGGWNNEGSDFGNPDGLQCILINPDTKEIIDAKGQGFCSIDRSVDDGNHYVMTWTGDANLYVKCRLATEEEDLSDGSKLHVGDIRCEYFDADNSESKLYKSYNISYDLNGGTANNPVNPKREISAVISRDATEWTVYYEPIGDQECYEPFSYDGDLNKCVAGHGGEYDLCNGANAKCDPFIPLLGPEEDGNKQLTFRCWHNMADTNNPESCLYDNLDVGSDAARGDEQYPFLEKVFGTSGYINVRALYDQYSWLCEAGTYYKGGDAVDTCTTCPAGSVCPEDTLCSTGAESIGISSCGGGYTSEAGATSCHPATYKVTLDKQGGTGGTDAYWYTYNSSKTCYYFADAGLTKCIDDSNGQNIIIPTRAGYTFDGYWTGKDGTGTQYVNANGLTVNNLYKTTGDRTLYAKWQPNTIKVTLDSDGATSAGTTAYWYQYNTNNKCYYYSDAALNTCMGGTTTHQKINTLPSKNGYAFGGYYTGKNGTGKQYITAAGYATGSIVDSVSSDITLYAKWTPVTVDCAAGTYLPRGKTECATCTSGKYCLGGEFEYSETADGGLTACPVDNRDEGDLPTNYWALEISSKTYLTPDGATSASQCRVFLNIATSDEFTNEMGTLLENSQYNTATQKYDKVLKYGWVYMPYVEAAYFTGPTCIEDEGEHIPAYTTINKCPDGSFCYAEEMEDMSSYYTCDNMPDTLGLRGQCPVGSYGTSGRCTVCGTAKTTATAGATSADACITCDGVRAEKTEEFFKVVTQLQPNWNSSKARVDRLCWSHQGCLPGYLYQGKTSTNSDEWPLGSDTFFPVGTCSILTYKYTYGAGGGVLADGNPTEWTVKTTPVTIKNPTRTGYTFAGWQTVLPDGQYITVTDEIIVPTNVKDVIGGLFDLHLAAQWTPNTYTITYNLNGGTNAVANPTTYTVETETITLAAPTKTGYAFGGWYSDAAFKNPITKIAHGSTGHVTLYAQWVVEGEYTIGYELNGGTNAETNPGTYTVETETITLADPTRTGYTFGGWYSESTFATLVTQIAKGSTGDKMLYAKWTPIKYTIKYNATIGTGTVADTNCTYDEDCTIAANGFTNGTQEFTGWTLNPTQPVVQFQPGKVVRNLTNRDGAVMTMYARWVACTACAAGAGANCELTAPVGVCKYATSCRVGYDTPVNAGKYNPSCSVITYEITYNLNGGTNPADAKTQYTVETADYTLPTPTWDGHTFIGWYSDAAFKNPITKIAHGSTGHVTLYAKWGTVSYNIVYNLNGGTNPADAKQSYTAESDDYTLPTPTKNGYYFAGWYTEAGFTNRVTKIASGSTGNKAFWAKWTTIPYTITYNLNGGTNPAGAKTQYTIESDDYTLPVPSKKGYDFGGWFTNDAFTGGAVTKIARGSTGAKTFWAKFTPMKIYCNPGKYLVAGATVCDAVCPAGSMCAGGEVTYTGTEQGRSVCPAGTFSQAGANTCTKCLSGAFSATDGATACTPCAAGTTNDGWGNTKCDIQCANGAHVSKWMQSTWSIGNGSMGQVVAGECEIESCATGYLLGDNECVGRITCVPGKYYDGTRLVPCPAGSYCLGGGETTPGVPSCATSCATVGDGSYNVSVPGASSAAGCTHKCDAYPIAGGVAKPVLEYAPYPTQCEFTGVSDTGNPCDIIDGRCVETRCNGNYELINGRCEPCGRDFALSYNMTAGNCIVTKCEIGYHPMGDGCAENTRECTIPGATSAVQEWNEKTNSFGACIVTECDDGYHIASNKCVSDTQACTVANGTGTQEWNHVSNTWGACVATECAAGYTNEKTESAEPTRECGPCRNGYGVDGTRVASSYIRGCEIASCMYQGEMYNLENNECVPICSVAGYSDETGTMKWNPVTKKCDRTSADGYRMW